MTAATMPPDDASSGTTELPRTGTGVREPGWWGMLMFCITEALLFFYFIGSYTYLRGTAVAFASHGGRSESLVIPALLTVALVSSSFTLRWGEKGIEHGDARRLVLGLTATIVLGIAFVMLQGVEFARQTHMPQANAYWSLFYTITGFHGAHVLLGLSMLGVILVRARRGHFTSSRFLAVQNGSLYWHTVDLVWIAIVGILYLAPHRW